MSLTRLLVVTDRFGKAPFGLSSAMFDSDELEARYGMKCFHAPHRELTDEMDSTTAAQTQPIVQRLTRGAAAVHMAEAEIANSVRFYMAVRRLMSRYGCNAFTIECREVCPMEIAAKYRFTPCMTYSMLKDAGYPAVCQTDVNALVPMMALSYLGRRSVYMGNPGFDAKNDVLTLLHDVPGLHMKGFDAPAGPYELRNFTVGGWGVTFRYDFTRDKGQVVTVARANPGQTKILAARGEIIDGFGVDQISCSLGVRVKVAGVKELFRQAADFGAHFVMAYGDYMDTLADLGRVAGFELVTV